MDDSANEGAGTEVVLADSGRDREATEFVLIDSGIE
jgi:hypothetical protein